MIRRSDHYRCKKRLKALGHNVVDINYVQYSISQSLRVAQIYRLTCRGEFFSNFAHPIDINHE